MAGIDACGVVLAAGAGRRFGGVKQLAPLDDRPLLSWAIDAACASRLERVVLVLGSNAERIRAAVPLNRAEVVVCRDWEEGMAASLRCAVDAAGDVEWTVVMLGDAPFLAPAAIEAVLGAAEAAPPEVAAVRLRTNGAPAHPVALRRSLSAGVRALRGDAGARALLEDAVVLEVDGDAFGDPGDVDTPEALEALQARTAAP